MCISWTIKGLISLMHGITMKINNKQSYHCHGDGSGFSVRWELNCYILCVEVNFMIVLIHYVST